MQLVNPCPVVLIAEFVSLLLHLETKCRQENRSEENLVVSEEGAKEVLDMPETSATKKNLLVDARCEL